MAESDRTNADAERVSDIVATLLRIYGHMVEADADCDLTDINAAIVGVRYTADIIEAQSKALAEAREALKPFLGDAAMEQILWGDMPDDATGSVTVKLGDFRRARAALTPTPENPNG